MTTQRPTKERIEDLRDEIEDLRSQISGLEDDLQDLESDLEEIPSVAEVARCIVAGCTNKAEDVLPFEYQSPANPAIEMRLMLPLCYTHWVNRP